MRASSMVRTNTATTTPNTASKRYFSRRTSLCPSPVASKPFRKKATRSTTNTVDPTGVGKAEKEGEAGDLVAAEELPVAEGEEVGEQPGHPQQTHRRFGYEAHKTT